MMLVIASSNKLQVVPVAEDRALPSGTLGIFAISDFVIVASSFFVIT